MRLLIISSEYPNMFGGVSDYTHHLAKNLRDTKEIEIVILTSDNEQINKNSTLKILPLIKNWNLSSLLKIINIVKEIKPDFINLQYVPYAYSKYGIPIWIILFTFYLLFKKYKLITTFHEIAIRFEPNPIFCLIAALQRFIAYALVLTSNRTIVICDYWKRMLYPFNNKIVRISIGSNILPIYVSEQEKENLRLKIAPEGEIVISTFGSIATYRRYDVFLEAIKEILRRNSLLSLKILFLGRHNELEKSKLEEKVSEFKLEKIVQFSGYLEPDDVYRYLISSDIFIMLESDYRGGISIKSGSLAAALLAGLPIIGTKGLMTDDFFLHKENVFFAKSLQVEDVIDAIQELIKSKDLRRKLSQGAKETYKKIIGWDTIASKYREVFNELR